MAKAKPFDIPKREVWEAFKKVKANQGAAGVDGQTIAEFEADLSNNLYRLWNRMSSGSYFPPPVRRVDLPKSDGRTRPLGIPTVGDRVAQEVVKRYLEPILEPIFHEDSYGYRPGRSAIDALRKTRQRCWRFDWVLDIDVQSYFDSIDWELLLKAVRHHTDCPWVLLYIERWLKAPVQMEDGSVVPRTAGTPQGGVVSPFLANLFLHYAFDIWMARSFPAIPFERYADDIICHCRSEEEARRRCGVPWRSAFGPAGWFYIRQRRSSSTARTRTGVATFRSSRLTSSAMLSAEKGSLARRSLRHFLPACGQSEGAEGDSADDPRVGIPPSDRQIPGGSGADVRPYIQGWINYYSHFYKSALYLDSASYRCLPDSLGAATSSNGCAGGPRAQGNGWRGSSGPIRTCSRIGAFCMATAEHREPYDARVCAVKTAGRILIQG